MRSYPFICAFSLLSVSALFAENNGIYGEVGFQYSNMTQATKSHVGPQMQKILLSLQMR